MTPRKFHLWSFITWMTLGACLTWLLRNNVPWVNFMSWYAIIITHLTGWGAGRAEEAADDTSDQ